MEVQDLLNGKKGSFGEIMDPIDHEKNKILYKDKTMTISLDNRFIYISSTWWGPIKNSMFTLGGLKGKTNQLKHGKLLTSELQLWEKHGPTINVQTHNKIMIDTTGKTELQILGEKIQKKMGRNLVYEVKSQIGPDHKPTITIEMTLPNDEKFKKTGKPGENKKQIANNIAKEILEKNLV